MVEPLISFSEFREAVAAEEEERFVWSDLERFDYDAPKARCALVSWRDAGRDHFGEATGGRWVVVMAGDGKRLSELHDWGVLNFGDPPWRRSQILYLVGRLGALEAAVSALAMPGPDFVYDFEVDAPVVPVRRGAGGSVESAAQVRGRWRRARGRTAADFEKAGSALLERDAFPGLPRVVPRGRLL